MVALYCYTGHIRDFINHLRKKNPLVEITLLSNLSPEVIREAIPDTAVKIEWYDVPEVKNIKWRWLRFQIIKYRQVSFFYNFSKNRNYDIVNVHFANRYMSYVYKYLRAMCSKLVITPWGSDILRRDSLQLKQLSKIYQLCDFVTTYPYSILGKKIIKEFSISTNKFVGNFFGSDIVDYSIKNGEFISVDDAKTHFGLQGRYVITCGYNLYASQRHNAIIEAIGEKKNQLPDNLTLLFPMTYGNNNPDYIQKCKEECDKRNLHAVFFTEYLSIDNLYKLRKAADIFIHVQTTDASSGTINEYLLCDKKIVHGSWIKYPELERFSPLFYYPVDDLEKLGDVIVDAYKSEKINQSKDLIDYVRSRGWETTSTKMNDFFMSIV